MPRTTMPIRGLRDTAPYHWDGIPGDPYGGNNTANVDGFDPPNCDVNEPESCTRHLLDGALATTMRMADDSSLNDEGKPGALTAAERDEMAKFLLSVPYPASQRRSYNNVLSDTARLGFRRFHITVIPSHIPGVNVCGDCHRMPFWVSTNTPGTGMDSPTWRGAYDRWLILPQGRHNMVDQFTQSELDSAISEQRMWVGDEGPLPGSNPRLPFWNMVTEGSTGFSGTFARQVTLNSSSANSALTAELLDALELSASEGGVVLQCEAVFIDEASAEPVALQFDGDLYQERDNGSRRFSRVELVSLAEEGDFVGTFTGRLGAKVDVDNPQPALWTLSSIQSQSGRQQFPVVSGGENSMLISGRHVQDGAHVIVDGRRVLGNVRCESGELPDCRFERVVVELATLPASPGMHFLQVQNRDGLFSNDFIFFTQQGAGCDCDVNDDQSVDIADVQTIINQALGSSPPGCDLNGDGAINVSDVQIVINAALGGGCQ